MNCCLQKYTTYQSTYFMEYSTQGIIKNPRINEILYLHQKIHTKQFLLCCLTCFVFVKHFLKQLGFSGEPMTNILMSPMQM